MQPKRIAYPSGDIRYKYYGKTTQEMIEKIGEMEEGQQREIITRNLANFMKMSYLTWNKDTVDDETIFNHLEDLSDGKLRMSESARLNHTAEILALSKEKVREKRRHQQEQQGRADDDDEEEAEEVIRISFPDMSPQDFRFSNEPEPHKQRTRAILTSHPEVRELIGKNPTTFWRSCSVSAPWSHWPGWFGMLPGTGCSCWPILSEHFLTIRCSC